MKFFVLLCYILFLSLSLFLLFPLIVTLTGKQVLLKISRACLYDVFTSISLIDFITSFNADDNNQQRKSFIRCMIFLVRYFHPWWWGVEQTNGAIFSGCVLLCTNRTTSSHYHCHLCCSSVATFILFIMFAIMRRYTGNYNSPRPKKDKEMKKKKSRRKKRGNLHHSHDSLQENVMMMDLIWLHWWLIKITYRQHCLIIQMKI